ncbi:MAG: hypothetical protein HYZ62_00925, partial [Candidatus Andersenbacteria bacterium]|nr:hypothetical protein [Candidatus Andersenbacteria bacterium]
MYVASKPQFRVALPPYAGSVARTFSAVRPPGMSTLPAKRVQSVPITRRQVRTPVPARMVSMAVSPMVPYVAQEYEQEVGEPLSEVAIEQPKRLFSLPFSLSFWPASLLTSKKKVQI